MQSETIRLPNFSVLIEEISPTQASAGYIRGEEFAVLLLDNSGGLAWNADAEFTLTPLSDSELQQQNIWEGLQEAQVLRSAKFFNPATYNPFAVLVAHFSRRNVAEKVRAARHPESHRGDKTK